MAKPEQTEKPTPKRRQEARSRGQVPRSTDLAGAVIFLAVVLVLNALGPSVMNGLGSSLRSYLEHIARHDDFNYSVMMTLFAQAGSGVVFAVLVVFAVAFVVGIVANIAQFGFLFTFQSIKPSFGKLNPINGFKTLLSKRSLVQLAKQLLKLFAVAIILYSVISSHLDIFAQVGRMEPSSFMNVLAGLIFEVSWKFGMLLVVVGLIDYAYERWQLEQNLKMSKHEVKDEFRQAEGNPEAKAAMKRRQREMSRRRMMQAVPRATVVVTNPTHFAVALEWDDVGMEAPVVVAKGADLIAKRIRDIAREHNIPIMENPPLARTLYERVELDQAIPPNLYAGVAQVIAFVYQLKRKTIA